MVGMRLLACADKFRGTLTAPEFGAAVAAGAVDHEVLVQPLADGACIEVVGNALRDAGTGGPTIALESTLECRRDFAGVLDGFREARACVRLLPEGEGGTVIGSDG